MHVADEGRLRELRQKIDATDRELVRLLLERSAAVQEVGRLKEHEKSPVYRPDREKQVYANIARYAREESDGKPALPDLSLEHIWREIMSASIAIEGGPAIAFLGPIASFSHQATRMRFGSSMREVPVATIGDVFRTVESDDAVAYGVVPAENTSEGSVGPTLDLLLTSPLKVYAEQYIRVHMYLLSAEPIELSAIRRIYSIRIAAEQCRNWLQRNLPMGSIEVIETQSTAAAAQMVAERKDGVAIASSLAADTYRLSIVAEKIEDSSQNVTRFFIIGKEQCEPTGDDKTSIICAISGSEKPGSLLRFLEPFHNCSINLTRIESRTTRRYYGEYNFFIDFCGHQRDPHVAPVLAEVQGYTTLLKILGSYPRMELP